MARLTRIVVPDLPHHVTQRGNRRQKLFVERGDYGLYRDLLAERCRANRVACWAYCLMPNHVHLIMTPSTADGIYSDTLLNPHSLKGREEWGLCKVSCLDGAPCQGFSRG